MDWGKARLTWISYGVVGIIYGASTKRKQWPVTVNERSLFLYDVHLCIVLHTYMLKK